MPAVGWRRVPTVFGVTFHEPFVDVDADQRDGLFFEVPGLRNACFVTLTVDHLRCLGGRGNAPHGVKSVHVERQVVELALVVGHRGVDVVVEFDEAVHELHTSRLEVWKMWAPYLWTRMPSRSSQ